MKRVLKKILMRPEKKLNATPMNLQQNSTKKRALVILPFVEINAYFNVVELINKNLHQLGYEIHGVVHNPDGAQLPDWWDHSYFVPELNRLIGQPKSKNGEIIPDGHSIDDWCSSEIIEFVKVLNRLWKFDLCVVHYAFFSKLFEFLPAETLKILYTHDIYTERNSRLLQAGLPQSLWFSVKADEEKKALERADIVMAIQEEDAQFFRTLAPNKKVITAPLFTEPEILKPRWLFGRKIRIGYFASSYVNNLKTFVDFYTAFSADQDLMKKFDLKVGGGICSHFPEKSENFQHADFKGRFDVPRDFYKGCDLIINPDFFQSGLKMKTFEGLSFGLPVLTSKNSTAGMDTFSDDHRLESMPDFTNALKKIARKPSLLKAMAASSVETYEYLIQKYDFKKIILEHEHKATGKSEI